MTILLFGLVQLSWSLIYRWILFMLLAVTSYYATGLYKARHLLYQAWHLLQKYKVIVCSLKVTNSIIWPKKSKTFLPNPLNAETWKLCKIRLNIMAADTVTPCVPRSSTVIVLAMQGDKVPTLNGDGFTLLFQCWRFTGNANIFSYFMKSIQYNKG